MFHHEVRDVDRPWASRVPEDDEEWDSADSGASASKRHRKAKKKSKKHQSRSSKRVNNDLMELDDEMKPHRFANEAVEWFDHLGASPNPHSTATPSSPTTVETSRLTAASTPRSMADESAQLIQDRDQSPTKGSVSSPLRTPPRPKKSSSKRNAPSAAELLAASTMAHQQNSASPISPLLTPPRDSPSRRSRSISSPRQASQTKTKSATTPPAAAPVEEKVSSTAATPAAIKTTEVENASASSSVDHIPRSYVETIQKAFGKKADLYNDVLQVSMNAHPREVRIAYFRRGREVLTDGDIKGNLKDDSPQSISLAVSEEAKLKFQAVSMAYEILSDARWRNAYDTHGLELPEQVEVATATDTQPSAPTKAVPVLRKSNSGEKSSRRKTGGVTWNEEVEELVFDDKTDIVSADDSSSESSKQKKSRKKKKKKEKRGKKKRIIVETDQLQRHLEKLDREAERHFVADFLDELESGMEELLSLGSSKKSDNTDQEKKKKKRQSVKESSKSACPPEESDAKKSIPKVEPTKAIPGSPAGSKTDKTFDSKFMNDVDDTFPSNDVRDVVSPGAKERVRSDVNQRVLDALKFDAERRAKKEMESINSPGDSRRKGSLNDIPIPSGRRKGPLFVAPDDIMIKKRRNRDADDGQGTVTTHDDTISTISSSVVDKRVRAGKTPQTIRKIVPLGKLSEERTKSDTESDNTSNRESTYYDPEPSVEPKRTSSNKSVDTRSTEANNRICERDGVICGLDLAAEGCVSPNRRKSSRRSSGSDQDPSTSSPSTRFSSRSDPTDPKTSKFHHHLLTYLNSMVNEVETWTSSSWKSTTDYMQKVMVTEEDLDGMMGIVRKEMERVPQAFKYEEQQQKKSPHRPIPKVVKTTT